jgi:phosphoserine phosphatase
MTRPASKSAKPARKSASDSSTARVAHPAPTRPVAHGSGFFQNTIALVYDFDGTLSPQPMQEYTVLPKIGVEPVEFWARVRRETLATQSDQMLVYMRHIVEALENEKIAVKREDFAAMAHAIRYFPGVEGWFNRVNAYVRAKSGGRIKVAHYLISAGQKEILEGVSIKKHFRRIYASEYHFDHHGRATFPKILVTDTMKTQFLFRINKGREQVNESINEHMPEGERPIPFQNMIYIGDGMTDVPSMALTKKNGGHTIAVFKEDEEETLVTCRKLLDAGRVDFIAPADYRPKGKLYRRVELLLDSIIAGIAYAQEVHDCKDEYSR